MGGVGSGVRKAPVARDAHNTILRPDDPADLEQMALTWHRERLGLTFGRAVRGISVDAELAEVEQKCRDEGVHSWDGRGIELCRIAAIAAWRRGE